MSRVEGYGCIIETIMVANANRDDDPEKAAAIAIIGKKLVEAEDNGLIREIACDNCESVFLVKIDGQVTLWERNDECDRTTEVNSAKRGKWLLNLNPAYIPASDKDPRRADL